MIPKHKLLGIVLFALPLISLSQENSPYSRYGIGNLAPQGNILNRGMGGISAAYSDPATVNYLNPASYGSLTRTTLDIGAEVDTRVLRSTKPLEKFTSNNAVISYLQVAFPLLYGNKKAIQKKMGWGVNLGLRPISKINYKIQRFNRITNIDSAATLFEGSGGLNEAFAGTGIQIKNFSIGANVGYIFGNKTYNTRLLLLNDTVNYLRSNSGTKTSIGGLSFNAGMQYMIPIKTGDTVKSVFKIGAYGTLQKSFTATQDIVRETFVFNPVSGSTDKLDSVFQQNGVKGKVQLPATYGIGFLMETEHWIYGVDLETSNWNNYRFFGQKDLVQNNWTVKAGFQYLPARINSRKYSQYVKYRAGIFFGPDYIVADKKLPQYAVSVGAGFPLKLRQSFYETQRSVMNLALEYGSRGNNSNNIRENILRISLGFTLSDVWFRRYKYD